MKVDLSNIEYFTEKNQSKLSPLEPAKILTNVSARFGN